MRTLVYYNVNEEAVPYARHGDLAPALATLEEFPNDMVAIVTAGSPIDTALQQGMED